MHDIGTNKQRQKQTLLSRIAVQEANLGKTLRQETVCEKWGLD